jgi:hypothetical protein
VFKAVFTQDTPASRNALKALLESSLNRRLDIVTVIANEPAVQSEPDRQIRYDIACTFNGGELANIEMTLWPRGAEPIRIEYYLSRLFVSQKLSGTRDFADLKRSYQLSILGDNLYKDRHAIHYFEYHDPERKTVFGGRTAIVTLELKKLERLTGKQPETMSVQERWGLFLRYAAEPEQLGLVNRLLEIEEGIAMAGEAILQLPKSQIEEMRRISREKYEVDQRQARNDLKRAEEECRRIKEECKRVEAERRQAETALKQTEAERKQAEAEREQAEAARKQAELERDAALQELAAFKKRIIPEL